MIFQNRQEAGRLLGEKLKKGVKTCLPAGRRGKRVVLGIPRGGVVVAAEVAKILEAPLNVLIVKKIGAPGNPELAVGAMGIDGTVVWNQELLASLRLTPNVLSEQVQSAKLKVQSYSQKFSCEAGSGSAGKAKKQDFKDKTIIVVDDGIATGATAEAALLYLGAEVQGHKGAKAKIILATPVIAADTVGKLEHLCDQLVYLDAPQDFWAVGQFYREFPQVEDKKVIKILNPKS